MNKAPENGVALFSGNVSQTEGQNELIIDAKIQEAIISEDQQKTYIKLNTRYETNK